MDGSKVVPEYFEEGGLQVDHYSSHFVTSSSSSPLVWHNWEPLWLQAFLGTTFFGFCSSHEVAPKNELKRYCIDCQSPACLICIDENSHTGHNVLKVYRYSRVDAVLKTEMKQHMDCSKIQAYTYNKEPFYVLNPIPHRGLQKGGKHGCDTYSRRLMDLSIIVIAHSLAS